MQTATVTGNLIQKSRSVVAWTFSAWTFSAREEQSRGNKKGHNKTFISDGHIHYPDYYGGSQVRTLMCIITYEKVHVKHTIYYNYT